MASIKKKIFTTPKGTVEPYAYLHKPDFGGEGFKNDRGTYKADITFPNDVAAKMIDAIVKCHEESYAQKLEAHEANPPVAQRGKKPLEPYEGDLPFIDNGDGTTTFKFKCHGSYEDKKTGNTVKINVGLFDATGRKLKDSPIVAGGSEVKVKFTMVPYGWSKVAGASVKLQLESVQILTLKELGGGNDEWDDASDEGDFSADDVKSHKGNSNEDPGYSEDDDRESDSGDDEDDGDF